METSARQALLVDAETGAVLFAKQIDEPFPPAALAKLMTMEVVFNALKSGRLTLDDIFTVSENAWRTGGAPSGGSTMFAKIKSQIALRDLIQGAIVQSANDACIVIAEGVAGSEAAFATVMTERARALGLKRSTFVNATGLPAEGQMVTARELADLARHLWSAYPEFYATYAQPEFTWNKITQRNRNPLLAMKIGADGLGTGYTEASGYAIVGSAADGDARLFLVLSGLESERERAREAGRLLEWGLNDFQRMRFVEAEEIVGQAQIYGGERAAVGLMPHQPVSIFVPKGNAGAVSARITYDGPLPAPVMKGDQIGTLEVMVSGTTSVRAPLYAAETVERGTIHQRAADAVLELVSGWLRGVLPV